MSIGCRRGKGGAIPPEGLAQRAAIIHALRSDEGVFVYGLDRLGLSGPDLQTAIEGIGGTGAAIFDGKVERQYRWTQEALELTNAMRAATHSLAIERTTPGRRKAQEERLIVGAPSKRERLRLHGLRRLLLDGSCGPCPHGRAGAAVPDTVGSPDHGVCVLGGRRHSTDGARG